MALKMPVRSAISSVSTASRLWPRNVSRCLPVTPNLANAWVILRTRSATGMSLLPAKVSRHAVIAASDSHFGTKARIRPRTCLLATLAILSSMSFWSRSLRGPSLVSMTCITVIWRLE
ncbi:hypothetical protein D3C86_1698900 [compost metagenome]